MWDVDDRGCYTCVWTVVYKKCLYLSLTFAMNQKLLLKIKVLTIMITLKDVKESGEHTLSPLCENNVPLVQHSLLNSQRKSTSKQRIPGVLTDKPEAVISKMILFPPLKPQAPNNLLFYIYLSL